MSDDIGTRGEALFYVLITRFCGRKRPYFRPHFLGEKFETLDYLVELVDAAPGTPYFFVQVRTTTLGYTSRAGNRRLKARVSRADMRRLVLYPAPTYVVGIDERQEVGYIISANDPKQAAPRSIPTTFPLTCGNLELLWLEVRAYWAGRDMSLSNSKFLDRG
jgi:hypothetical protein